MLHDGKRTANCFTFDVRDGSYRASKCMPDVASFSVVPQVVDGKLYVLGWTDAGKSMFVWD